MTGSGRFTFAAGGRVIAFFLAALLVAWPASAQDIQLPHGLFADAPPPAPGAGVNPSAERRRFVFVNVDLLDDQSVLLNLFDDVSVVAVRDRVVGRGWGSFTWFGHVDGVAHSSVILTVRDGALGAGVIDWPGALFELNATPDGRIVIEKINELDLPPHVDPIPIVPGLEPEAPPAEQQSPAAAQPSDDGGVIDVMVLYTPLARTNWGGQAGIESRITNAIAATNLANTNSLVGFTLNLIHTGEVNYTETGNMSVTLSNLRRTTDGKMDEVHAWRDQYGADLVSLVSEDTSNCGYAYLMSNVSTSFAPFAFSVVNGSCLTNQTLAHEFGHNQGSHHDRDNASSTPAYLYSYGYRTQELPNNFRTVMAYSCSWGCSRVSYFSNPDVFYDGTPTGIDHDLDPVNSADNARSLDNTAPTVAQFRLSVAPPPVGPPAAPTNLMATAISDSRIDLSWTDNASDETGFEILVSLDGASFGQLTTVAANAESYADVGLSPSTTYYYRVRAYNDFDGDSQPDYSDVSNDASATTPAPLLYVDYVAVAETPIAGSVSGSYLDTTDVSGVEQIAERQSGGKKSNRYSYLEHHWSFDVASGQAWTFMADVYSDPPTDTDMFELFYSTDGTNFSYMFTAKTTDDSTYQSFVLPSGGQVDIMVADSDQTPGNNVLDSVVVKHMYIRAETAGAIDPPAAPTDLAATKVSASEIDLAWLYPSNDEPGFTIERRLDGESFAPLTTTTETAYSDMGLSPGTAYHYRVDAYNTAGSSAYSNVASDITDDAISILSVVLHKVKGVHHVDLTWTGAPPGTNNVDIWRDRVDTSIPCAQAANCTTTANDEAHTDNTGGKGAATYDYEVCEAGGFVCSAPVTVIS